MTIKELKEILDKYDEDYNLYVEYGNRSIPLKEVRHIGMKDLELGV